MRMEFIKNSRLQIIRVVKELVGRNGQRALKVSRKIQTEPLNLGSVKRPLNKDILRFEYKS